MVDSVTQHERIVVGIDGSPASSAALRWAADEAIRRDGRLEAVIAWRPSVASGPPAGRPPASARSLAEREEDAEVLLESALAQLGGVQQGRVEVERKVMRGSPHRVLVEAADGASMLVIGGRSGKLAGKLPWSTGQHVVHEAHCPVVVVPVNGAPGQASGVSSSAPHSSATDS
jgi:nucleotide-binding universal stress UspA family protein